MFKLSELNNILLENSANGGLILLIGRPSMYKTETCVNAMAKLIDKEGCLYFDLADGVVPFFVKENKEYIINDFLTSIEIIKTIEQKLKSKKIKYVFIDSFEYLNDVSDWFRVKLTSIIYKYKIVITVIQTQKRKFQENVSLIKDIDALVRNDLFIKTADKVLMVHDEQFGIEKKKEHTVITELKYL